MSLRDTRIMTAMLAAFAMAGCAPYSARPASVPPALVPYYSQLPNDRAFGRNRRRDQKRRAAKRIGGRRRGR